MVKQKAEPKIGKKKMSALKVFNERNFSTIGDYLEAATILNGEFHEKEDSRSEDYEFVCREIFSNANKLYNLIVIGMPRTADIFKSANAIGVIIV